jgi:hypothetical protein
MGTCSSAYCQPDITDKFVGTVEHLNGIVTFDLKTNLFHIVTWNKKEQTFYPTVYDDHIMTDPYSLSYKCKLSYSPLIRHSPEWDRYVEYAANSRVYPIPTDFCVGFLGRNKFMYVSRIVLFAKIDDANQINIISDPWLIQSMAQYKKLEPKNGLYLARSIDNIIFDTSLYEQKYQYEDNKLIDADIMNPSFHQKKWIKFLTAIRSNKILSLKIELFIYS